MRGRRKTRGRNDHRSSHTIGFFRAVRAKLTQQKSSAFWEKSDVIRDEILQTHKVDQSAIESFQTNRREGQDLRNVIRRDECIAKAKGD